MDDPLFRLVTLTPTSLIDRIDEHMHRARLRNRSDAVRALLEVGLEHSGLAPSDAAAPAIGEPAPDRVLPTVTVADSANFGNVPMVAQWLNRAIPEHHRAAFTEDELYRSIWRKPDGYDLQLPDRKVICAAMGELGWVKSQRRNGAVTEHWWSHPDW